MAQAQIVIDGVSHVYRPPSGRSVLALEEVSLDVGNREFVALLGPSGCGKSTLLYLLGGFLPIEKGKILVDGKPTLEYKVQRDYLWMMGDNRDNSLDSRYWGYAPVENVVGSGLFIYWSMFNPPYAPGEGDPDEVQKFHIRWNRIANLIH